MGWNEIDHGTVEEATAVFAAARIAFEENAAKIKSAEEALSKVRRKNFELHTTLKNAQEKLVEQRHVAAGGCAYYVNGEWRTSLCQNKAKPESRYCGTHKRVAERRESFAKA